MKNVDNGSIGEIRTKAFLIDRFWILERSIDIHGADYIIQRKLSEQNILDKIPPRFGVVQVKFMQDENTSHYIHSDYVLNVGGEPRREFFLMIHTGDETNNKKYLISADEIKNDFKVCSVGKNSGKYYIPGTVLRSSKYEVTNNKGALDRIEHTIRLADFASNRTFLFRTVPSLFTKEEIDYDFTRPLPTNEGIDIPNAFRKLKRQLSSIIFEVEEVSDKIKVALETTNPLDTIGVIKDLLKEHGLFDYPIDNLEQIELAAKEHEAKHNCLKEIGVLDNYCDIRRKIESDTIEFLEPIIEEGFTKNKGYVLTLDYNYKDLTGCSISQEVKDKSDIPVGKDTLSYMSDIILSDPGKIVFYLFPYYYREYIGENWNERLKNIIYSYIDQIMDEIYLNLFPDQRE